jgi:hypothetical protein
VKKPSPVQANALQRPPRTATIFLPTLLGLAIFSITCGGGATKDVPAAMTLSPASLSFGARHLESSSVAESLNLTNSGIVPLDIAGIEFAGSNPGDFSQTTTCENSLAAGATCTISVTFKPTASGTRTATVSIRDNAADSPQSVSLTGTGTSTTSTVSLSASSLAFGNQPVDLTSSSQTVAVTNTGSTALSITSIASTGTNAGDFAQNNTCNSSVPAAGTCTVVVTFTPSVSSAETASLNIADDANGSPQEVALSGTGIHDVILNWAAPASGAVTGYNVYRGTASGGESATPLNSAPVAGTTYCDENVQAGQTYYYVLTTVDGDSQSADSAEVSAAVP